MDDLGVFRTSAILGGIVTALILSLLFALRAVTSRSEHPGWSSGRLAFISMGLSMLVLFGLFAWFNLGPLPAEHHARLNSGLREGCKSGCAEQGHSAIACVPYCDCFVERLNAEFSGRRLAIYVQSFPASPDVSMTEHLTQVGNECAAEHGLRSAGPGQGASSAS